MPAVRMLTSVADAEFAYGFGETVELSGEVASRWAADGLCELVRGQRVETPEDRVSTPEGAVRRGPGRPRKNPA